MIEKKISYDINIEKPSKTKPVKQGGVFNYLGKQKTVSAPRRWRSSPKHPIAHLAYITKDEEKILIDLNLYGSLKGKPNKGPSGIMSLQGSGSGSAGAGTGDGPGTGASEGTAQGPGPNEAGAGTDDGPGTGESEGSSLGDAPGTQGGTVGEAQAAAESVSADNVSMAAQAAQEDAATAAAANTSTTSGVMSTLGNMAKAAINAYARFSPVGMAMTAIDNARRGVTGPSDDTQEQSSVQIGPAQSISDGGGGITTLPEYAPLVNISTGDNLLDSLIARYRIDPSAFGIR